MPRPKFQDWPDGEDSLEPSEVVRMYGEGFMGAKSDPESHAALISEARYRSVADAAHANGWADTGKGKLILPSTHVESAFPGCWPGPAQERGDCVSHNEKNACLTALVMDVVDGTPDEKTGKIEGLPVVPPKGISEGVLSSEWSYWWRGYNGDGWSCSTAARVSVKHGVMLRQAYPELGIDLSSYSGRLAGKYGRQSPPSKIDDIGRRHLIRDATSLDSAEEWRDALANGYGLSTCGDEGFSSTRDSNGVSRRRGSWSHAMACVGCDDRQWAYDNYGGPLMLILNSWGIWNDGSRKVHGSNEQIPKGSFWARWSDVRRRTCYAHTGIGGWAARSFNWDDLSHITG